MKELLKQWLTKIACCHKWEIHHTVNHHEFNWSVRPYKQTQTLICQKCGKIEKITL